MEFVTRPPSSNWEPVESAWAGSFWVWYKPPQAPFGLLVQRTADDGAQSVSLRQLLETLGIHAEHVAAWSVGGAVYDAQFGRNPLLDAPLPTLGSNSPLVVHLHPPPVAPVFVPPVLTMPAVAPVMEAPAPASTTGNSVYDRIDADWNASQQLEKNMVATRKQLNSTLTRVNSLNRDLSAEERRFADRMDLNEWQDARRWMRDVAARLSRFIKDHDIGMTSAAGRRHWYEEIYQQQIVPRLPLTDAEQMARQFEMYRKTLQTLHNNMQNADKIASQDGERRAQQILSRIAARTRTARTKR